MFLSSPFSSFYSSPFSPFLSSPRIPIFLFCGSLAESRSSVSPHLSTSSFDSEVTMIPESSHKKCCISTFFWFCYALAPVFVLVSSQFSSPLTALLKVPFVKFFPHPTSLLASIVSSLFPFLLYILPPSPSASFFYSSLYLIAFCGWFDPQLISLNLLHCYVSGSISAYPSTKLIYLQSFQNGLSLPHYSSLCYRIADLKIFLPLPLSQTISQTCFNADVIFTVCCVWPSLLLLFLHHILISTHRPFCILHFLSTSVFRLNFSFLECYYLGFSYILTSLKPPIFRL